MKNTMHNFFHKNLIMVVIISQILIVFGGLAINVVSDISEQNSQYSEYLETMRHLEEHLSDNSENKFAANMALTRVNLRSRTRSEDYYLNTNVNL